MPWSIVLTTQLALYFTPQPPKYDARDFSEILSLKNALKIYRSRYGEYPPDFSTGDPKTEITQHLQKVFPDRLWELDLPKDLTGLGPQNALHFWLRGFGSDSRLPLTGINRGTVPLYDFDSRRILQRAYYSRSGNAPFVYFRSQTYAKARCNIPGCGTAYPYLAAKSNVGPSVPGGQKSGTSAAKDKRRFEEDPGFQIVSAGIDGNFGSNQVSSGSAIFGGQADNLTNFRYGPIGNGSIENYRSRLIRTRLFALALAIFCLAAYPCVTLFRKRSRGVQPLRKLVARQGAEKPHSSRWRNILRTHHQKNKLDAMSRMSNAGD